MKLLSLVLLAGTAVAGSQRWDNTCIITALNNGEDDSPAIRQAFQDCGKNGNIVFQENTTYNIQTTLQLHNLSNVQVDLRGTLLVCETILNLDGFVVLARLTKYNSSLPMFTIGFGMVHITTSRIFPLPWSIQEKILLLTDTIRASSMDRDKSGMTWHLGLGDSTGGLSPSVSGT